MAKSPGGGGVRRRRTSLLGYFEPTWIGVTVGRRSGRRTAPIFPLAMWNVHGRQFTGTTRTTNALESFHHAFNSLLSCKHPTIWVLLNAIHRQQALTDNTLVHIARGEQKPVTAKQTTRNARIVTLVSTYSSIDADITLRVDIVVFDIRIGTFINSIMGQDPDYVTEYFSMCQYQNVTVV